MWLYGSTGQWIIRRYRLFALTVWNTHLLFCLRRMKRTTGVKLSILLRNGWLFPMFFACSAPCYSLSRYKRGNSYFLVTCFVGVWLRTNGASRGLDVDVTIAMSFLRTRRKCVVMGYRLGLRAVPLNEVDNGAFSITDRRLIILQWTGAMQIRFWKIVPLGLDFSTTSIAFLHRRKNLSIPWFFISLMCFRL